MYNNQCRQALDTTAVNAQTVIANGLINFDTNSILEGCSISHEAGSPTVDVKCKGIYYVSFNADILPTAAGDIVISLLNNGVAIPGASATITAVAASTYHVSLDRLIKVLKSCQCISNDANLQIQVSASATISNANLVVIKV